MPIVDRTRFQTFVDLQVQSRAHKVSQEKPVIIHQLIIKIYVVVVEELVQMHKYVGVQLCVETWAITVKCIMLCLASIYLRAANVYMITGIAS